MNKKIIIKTSDLEDKNKIEKFFIFLDIKFSKLKNLEKVNTNKEIGFRKTEIEKRT